jgi:hypothetical protein
MSFPFLYLVSFCWPLWKPIIRHAHYGRPNNVALVNREARPNLPRSLAAPGSDNDSERGFDSLATISVSGLVKLADALDLLVDQIFHVELAKRVQIFLRGAVVVDVLGDLRQHRDNKLIWTGETCRCPRSSRSLDIPRRTRQTRSDLIAWCRSCRRPRRSSTASRRSAYLDW